MNRLHLADGGTAVFLTIEDCNQWALNWPCSFFRGKSVFAEFDYAGDLIDLEVTGSDTEDTPADEFNAMIADCHIRSRSIPIRLRPELPSLFDPQSLATCVDQALTVDRALTSMQDRKKLFRDSIVRGFHQLGLRRFTLDSGAGYRLEDSTRHTFDASAAKRALGERWVEANTTSKEIESLKRVKP